MTCVLTLLGLLLLPATAWSHANLRGTDPPQGARLAVPPPSIRLWFDEAVVPEVTVESSGWPSTKVAAIPFAEGRELQTSTRWLA